MDSKVKVTRDWPIANLQASIALLRDNLRSKLSTVGPSVKPVHEIVFLSPCFATKALICFLMAGVKTDEPGLKPLKVI